MEAIRMSWEVMESMESGPGLDVLVASRGQVLSGEGEDEQMLSPVSSGRQLSP